MSGKTGKRMAGDYEIFQAVHIGDKEIVLGENPQDTTGADICAPFAKIMHCLIYILMSCAATTFRR